MISEGPSIEKGDIVVLHSEKSSALVKVEEGRIKVSGFGVFDPSTLLGKRYGDIHRFGPDTADLLKPNLPLLYRAFTRNAQIITLKDAMNIVGELGIGNGSSVIEIGVGSGFMSAVLLWFCGDKGEVVSYERRKDFANVASKNIVAAGLDGNWILRINDGADLVDTDRFDSAVVDIPQPRDVIPKLKEVMLKGAKAAFYLPTYDQLARCIENLKSAEFKEIRAREILIRDITTTTGSIRPQFDMLGHTGFLLFARRG